MKRILKFLFSLCFILFGVGLMCYPFIANFLFENRNDSVIETYDRVVDDANEEEFEKMIEDAHKYNKTLASGHVQLHDPFSEDIEGLSNEDYLGLLNIDGNGVMGYINIPCIDVLLPIYHTTTDEVLEMGVGHLEGTSLPVGGDSVHTVLTGHTGLSKAKMFTDLIDMEEGDIFILKILDQKIAYKVDQLKVVLPEEIADLRIENCKDMCTLVTCTPYGVNDHRLLVRGTRTEYVEDMEDEVFVKSTSEKGSQWMEQYQKSLYIAIGLILFALLILIVRGVRGRKS